MLMSESQLRSIIRASILKEQTSPGSKANPQKYLSSKRDKLETITWKGKKYKALGFLEKGNPVALIKKSDLKPQDTSTSGPFQLLGKDKITIINSDDKRVYNLAQYEGGSSVPVFVRDNTKDVKLDIVKVDYGDPSSADWAIEIGSYIGMIPGVGTPVDLGSAVLAVIKDPPDYLLGALSVLCSAPILGLAAGAAKIAGKGVIKTGARAVGREIADEVIEEAAEALVKYLKSKDVEISEKVFGSLRKQLDGTLEYLEKQMKKFAQNHDIFGLCALTEEKGPGGCADSVAEGTKRIKELKTVSERFFDSVKARFELEIRGKVVTPAAYVNVIEDKAKREAGRASKQLFRSAVDREFFEENVKFVHKVGAYTNPGGPPANKKLTILDWLETSSGKNDISAYGFYKDTPDDKISEIIQAGRANDIVELEGRLTYYGRMDVQSEKTATATPEVAKYYKDSGLPKRPARTALEPVAPVKPGSSPPKGTFKSGDNYYPKDTSEMVIDKASFDARVKKIGPEGHPSEAILSNWKVKKYTIAPGVANDGVRRSDLWKMLSSTNFADEIKKAREATAFFNSPKKNASSAPNIYELVEMLDKVKILFAEYTPGYGKTLTVQELRAIKEFQESGVEVLIDSRYMGGSGIEKIDKYLPDDFNSIFDFIDEVQQVTFATVEVGGRSAAINSPNVSNAMNLSGQQYKYIKKQLEEVHQIISEYKSQVRAGYNPGR
jgi:hypothetical protein